MIKIYPEWNVNTISGNDKDMGVVIKIYPEWNVNQEREFLQLFNILLKSIQSGM